MTVQIAIHSGERNDYNPPKSQVKKLKLLAVPAHP